MASSLDTRVKTTFPEEPEQPGEQEGVAAAWGMIWVLIGFKLFTVALILWLCLNDVSITLMLWLNAPWWILIGCLVGGSSLAYWRLWRVRLKRHKLVRSEWDVPSDYDYNEEERKVR